METARDIFEDVFGAPGEDFPEEEWNKLCSAFTFGWESALKFDKEFKEQGREAFREMLRASQNVSRKTKGLQFKTI